MQCLRGWISYKSKLMISTMENIAETSLDKQKHISDGQTAALEALHTMTSFQSVALEEIRGTLQRLIEVGHNQQKQEQLKQAHDHLVENSKTILAAQESRVIKAFLVYSIPIFSLYMFSSTKQTYNVRPRAIYRLCNGSRNCNWESLTLTFEEICKAAYISCQQS